MKKRLLSTFTAVCLCATLICTAMVFSVNAEGSAAVSLGSATGSKGDKVTVNVNLSENPGLIGLELDVSYDTSKLKLVDVSDAGVLSGYGSPTDYSGDSYRLYWADALASKDNTSTGTIATMTFEIVDDLDSATAITMSSSSGSINKDIEDVSVSCAGGSVSPKASSTTTTKAADPSVNSTTAAQVTTTKKATATTTKKVSSTTKKATTTRSNSYDNYYELGDNDTTSYTELETDYWWMTTESTSEPDSESETETTTEVEEQGGGLSKTKTVLVVLMVCFAIIGVAIIVSIVKKSKN